MYIEIVSVPTWSFSLPVCNTTQSEDDSALILLNNLQQQQQEDHSPTSDHIQRSESGNSGFCSQAQVTHLQTKPDSDGEEAN